MKIALNNSIEEFDMNEITVQQLLNTKKYSFKLLIIKINGSLINKEDYNKVIIKDGDKVDVIHLMSGG